MNLPKIWILHRCDHVLRRLDNERWCPMGYILDRSVTRATAWSPSLYALGTIIPREHSRSLYNPYKLKSLNQQTKRK